MQQETLYVVKSNIGYLSQDDDDGLVGWTPSFAIATLYPRIDVAVAAVNRYPEGLRDRLKVKIQKIEVKEV